MHSTVFSPSMGGVETVGEILANQWTRMGMEVRVSTDIIASRDEFSFSVNRRPAVSTMWKLTRWADVIFHNQPSARAAWAPLMSRKPWFATVHTWLPVYQREEKLSLRRALFNPCRFLAVSDAIARHLPNGQSQRVSNPYRSEIYVMNGTGNRDLDLLYVGRLVSDKGVTFLIEALAKLKTIGLCPKLEIVGDGPERNTLESLCDEYRLRDQVVFKGALTADHIASSMNRARFTVIPSIWQEPFGLVALEALACGSVPVVSRVGGLPEAVGEHGVFFEGGDVDSLAATLKGLLANNSGYAPSAGEIQKHLREHHPERVAARYLEIFLSSTAQKHKRLQDKKKS